MLYRKILTERREVCPNVSVKKQKILTERIEVRPNVSVKKQLALKIAAGRVT